MAYATKDDILKVIPQSVLLSLVDDEGVGNITSNGDARVTEAIESAKEEIDAYLQGRYDLPFADQGPPILSKLAVDIAVYNLYSRIQEEVSETRIQRYNQAKQTLREINAGKIQLVSINGSEVTGEVKVRWHAM